ncbi:MAG: hypothetical protein JWO04_5595 [Gammaproteobacteria bacterium]|nr:hypothetical protein [Gammaproteobacteria bacterium]
MAGDVGDANSDRVGGIGRGRRAPPSRGRSRGRSSIRARGVRPEFEKRSFRQMRTHARTPAFRIQDAAWRLGTDSRGTLVGGGAGRAAGALPQEARRGRWRNRWRESPEGVGGSGVGGDQMSAESEAAGSQRPRGVRGRRGSGSSCGRGRAGVSPPGEVEIGGRSPSRPSRSPGDGAGRDRRRGRCWRGRRS